MYKPVEKLAIDRSRISALEPQIAQALQMPGLRPEFSSLSDYRIRVSRTEDQLAKAISVRSRAYERHFPGFGERLSRPEAADMHPDTVVLIAESRTTGEAAGTVRLQTNIHAPCEFESQLDLPERFKGTTIAQISRLGVRPGRLGVGVKAALFKSILRYCMAAQIRWIMVGAHPPMDRNYVGLDFEDVFDEDFRVPLPSSGTIPLRIMAFEVPTAERRWKEANSPYYSYMILEYTPDIEIFSSVGGMWVNPRKRPNPPNLVSDDGSIYTQNAAVR